MFKISVHRDRWTDVFCADAKDRELAEFSPRGLRDSGTFGQFIVVPLVSARGHQPSARPVVLIARLDALPGAASLSTVLSMLNAHRDAIRGVSEAASSNEARPHADALRHAGADIVTQLLAVRGMVHDSVGDARPRRALALGWAAILLLSVLLGVGSFVARGLWRQGTALGGRADAAHSRLAQLEGLLAIKADANALERVPDRDEVQSLLADKVGRSEFQQALEARSPGVGAPGAEATPARGADQEQLAELRSELDRVKAQLAGMRDITLRLPEAPRPDPRETIASLGADPGVPAGPPAASDDAARLRQLADDVTMLQRRTRALEARITPLERPAGSR